ncbi:hypothetical protein D1V07_01145 [Salmonella enterica]|nr:hypothetical protein [Salmonella enterica]ECH1663033.1 hypothetical protein [Salmonella enterica]ECO8796803.1 hypothetical protein [Salmonella enterica]EKE8131725.1 hypothetical protein [Salmonella enterica]ELK5343162.1 hypothetical protein [Salmonella enterica]
MGVYRWHLVFPLIVYSVLSYSATPDLSNILSRAFSDADSICSNKPSITDTFEPYYFHGGNYYVNYKGCIYVAKGVVVAPDGTDYAAANWLPVKALPPDIPMNESHIRKPDSGDDSGGDTGDSGDSGGGSTEPSNPGVTPPVNPPVNPDGSSTVRQLYDQYDNCSIQLSSYPKPNFDDYNPSVDYNYNAQVKQCNSVLDRLTSLIKSGSINGASENNLDFITGDGSGGFYKCKKNPYTPQEWADQGKLYPGPVLGSQLVKNREREIGYNCHIVDGKNKCDWHLNFNYGTDNGHGTSVCNSVYTSSLNPGESGGSGGGSDGGSCPDGQVHFPGQGCSVLQCPPGYHAVNGDTPSSSPYCAPGSGSTGLPDTGSSGGDTDSGDDSGPGLSTPSLDIPDLTLAPLWNIWPSARDFKLTLPAAQCPVFNIEVFGTTHKIDTFCTLFTPDIIAIIRAICILTASVISFVIVLRS